jgi:subtilisin family serine protease
MSSPHVAGAAALLAEKKAVKLTQSQMEAVLENTAILPPLTYVNTVGFPSATLRYMSVYVGIGPVGYYWTQWNDNAVGNGLLQVDAAVAAVGG